MTLPGVPTGREEKRTQPDYTLVFKLSVADAVEWGEQTYKQAQQRYRVERASTVLKWLRKHRGQDRLASEH